MPPCTPSLGRKDFVKHLCLVRTGNRCQTYYDAHFACDPRLLQRVRITRLMCFSPLCKFLYLSRLSIVHFTQCRDEQPTGHLPPKENGKQFRTAHSLRTVFKRSRSLDHQVKHVPRTLQRNQNWKLSANQVCNDLITFGESEVYPMHFGCASRSLILSNSTSAPVFAEL